MSFQKFIYFIATCALFACEMNSGTLDSRQSATIDKNDLDAEAVGSRGSSTGDAGKKCNGCWDSTNVCRGGVYDDKCGKNGSACVDCAAKNMSCQRVTGKCRATPPCNATTCATGCCDEYGICHPTPDVTNCGTKGGNCANCTYGYSPGSICCKSKGGCYPYEQCS